ncbi:MAG TPA: Xaa-Pro peptidase family protein [Candidatus Limnocylindrales bacterium]|nr:Xaa-Pro peptidase family protein [Candidatus Limnocylindrales bacterium]
MTTEAPAPTISAHRFAERIERAQAGLPDHAAEALLLGVGADLRYLTGYTPILTERLTMLVLPSSGPAILVAPRLEAMAAATCPAASEGSVEVVAWDETQDAHGLVADRLSASGGRILVSADLWAMHVLALQDALPGRPFGLATEILRDLRMAKDADEIALLRLAAHAADRVLEAIASGPLVGRTEREVSLEILDRLVAEGHDAAQFAIVASGPNSASPHHHPGDRRIEAGEPVVFDLGGPYAGYCSDMTRTVWVAGPDRIPPTAEFLAIYDLVRRANAEATAAVRPGVACEALDAAARTVIEAGGHGPAFLHRVGHGIGLETHEEPYLVGGNSEPLRVGVAFSIEPGIYLADRHGVRIEDIVVCGGQGPDVLNEATRDLLIVDG